MNASLPLLEKTAQATVGIRSQIPSTHNSAAIGLGTDRRTGGVLIDPDGLVLTVNYGLIGAQSLIVTLTGGEQRQGWVVAQDYASGLGLVRIDGHHLPHLTPVPSTSCATGQDVFVVSAVGGDERRADSGIITYIGPFDAVWEYGIDRCLMASAMNFGVGGGPMCNARAEMVALAYLSPAEIGRSVLAIPCEYFLNARTELMGQGRSAHSSTRPWLGLLAYSLRDHVVIAGVMPGGPSEKAGLKPGDVVLEVDGQGVVERRDFYHVLWNRHPGDLLNLKVFRDNGARTLTLRAIAVEEYFG